MAEIDDFDLDRSTTQAWAEFTGRLAEVISMIDESADLTIRSFTASADPPYVRLSCPAGWRSGPRRRPTPAWARATS